MKIIAALLLPLILFAFTPAHAASGGCIGIQSYCDGMRKSSSSSPAFPSTSSSVSLNPAAVPTNKSLGLEMIYFSPSPDFALVTGTGRVGAALSPTSAEETFFGNPGFEFSDDYLQRHIEKKKFDSKKVALATAVNIWDNKSKGLKKLSLNLGLLGRYNKITKSVKPGAGLSAVAGPLTLGYAQAQDEFGIDDPTFTPFEYQTETFSAGLSLTSLAIDYSSLTLTAEDGFEPIKIQLVTASLLLKKWIITVAQRTENSDRPEYDEATQSLIFKEKKTDTFLGLQYALHKKILIGAFYNYYLLDDLSLGLTVFAF